MRILPQQTRKVSGKVKCYAEIAHLVSEMFTLCHQPLGHFPSAIALAHCQVEHRHPKKFFVMHDGEVVINPRILESQHPTTHIEGCMSFAFRGSKKVQRFQQLTVEYMNDKDEIVMESVEGLRAFVFQHEIDHMNGKAIYS